MLLFADQSILILQRHLQTSFASTPISIIWTNCLRGLPAPLRPSFPLCFLNIPFFKIHAQIFVGHIVPSVLRYIDFFIKMPSFSLHPIYFRGCCAILLYLMILSIPVVVYDSINGLKGLCWKLVDHGFVCITTLSSYITATFAKDFHNLVQDIGLIFATQFSWNTFTYDFAAILAQKLTESICCFTYGLWSDGILVLNFHWGEKPYEVLANEFCEIGRRILITLSAIAFWLECPMSL